MTVKEIQAIGLLLLLGLFIGRVVMKGIKEMNGLDDEM